MSTFIIASVQMPINQVKRARTSVSLWEQRWPHRTCGSFSGAPKNMWTTNLAHLISFTPFLLECSLPPCSSALITSLTRSEVHKDQVLWDITMVRMCPHPAFSYDSCIFFLTTVIVWHQYLSSLLDQDDPACVRACESHVQWLAQWLVNSRAQVLAEGLNEECEQPCEKA